MALLVLAWRFLVAGSAHALPPGAACYTVDPSTRSVLIWNIKTGDVFHDDMLRQFFDDNKSNFPAGSYWAKAPEMVRNVKTSTVDKTFTFGSCPGR